MFYQNFVTERKIDEELARTTRFVGDKDKLKSMIANFGEGIWQFFEILNHSNCFHCEF